jgi:FtsP/CotA-like multicopper oxidase with cupredoxin domain
VPQAVEYVAPATYSGRVRAQIRAGSAGHTVTARLRNVTDSATAGTSSGVLGVTMTEVTFVVSIVAGKRYRLELSADTSGARAYGIGSVEAA